MQLTPLNSFLNKHAGQKGFVCGAGTSLKDIPKDLARHGIVFCVNSSGLHFDEFQYLYLTDPAVYEMAYWDEVVNKAKNIVFANPQLYEHAVKTQKNYPDKRCYLLTRNYDARNSYNFADDILWIGADAPISAAHLAHKMGCRPIVLCGIDLCYNEGQRYFDEEAYKHKENSPYKDAFAKEYKTGLLHGQGFTTDIWLNISLPCWEKVFQQNEVERDEVLNTSAISKIPFFKFVDINDLINK